MGEIFERPTPAGGATLDWTGERLTGGVSGQIEIEHLQRYFLARHLCRGLDVLDVASGEGYGAALLAQVARSVVGVEIAPEAVAHAAAAYPAANLRFERGDARALPLPDASLDAVVSFETLEHFAEHDRFVAEVRRVLRPGGLLVLSSPERDVYSPAGSAANPFHARELSRAELEALLGGAFRHVRLLAQRPLIGAAMVAADEEGEAPAAGFLTFERRGPRHYEENRGLPRPPYLLAVASDAALPPVPSSLLVETDEVGRTVSLASAAAGLEAALAGARAEAAAHAEAHAGAAAAHAEAAARAATAEAALAEARAETTAALAEARAALRREGERARHEVEAATSERDDLAARLDAAVRDLATARAQRDALRVAVRTSLRRRGDAGGGAAGHAAAPVLAPPLPPSASGEEAWRRRYFALANQAAPVLRRLGLFEATRRVVRPLRRVARDAVFGRRP